MVRQSILKIKAMLLCIVYAMFFVDTVDTKILVFVALTYSTYISMDFQSEKKFWKAQNQGFSTVSTVLTLPAHFGS